MRMIMLGIVLCLGANVAIAQTPENEAGPAPIPLRADAPDHVKTYVFAASARAEMRAEHYRKLVSEAEARLVAVKRGRIDRTVEEAVEREGRWFFRDARTKRSHIEKAEHRVSELEAKHAEWSRPDAMADLPIIGEGAIGGLEVGRIGRIEWIKIAQVLSDDEMLATISWYDPRTDRMRNTNLLWIAGVSTEGLVDDRSLKLDRIFEVVGTRQYNAALGGQRTVLELRPFDLSKYLAAP